MSTAVQAIKQRTPIGEMFATPSGLDRAGDPMQAWQAAWQQLSARDPQATFVYAVTTTGVYCRPGCGSRRPRAENVQFFDSTQQAAAAGFRPCQRCRPDGLQEEAVIANCLVRHLRHNLDRTITLAELARLAGRTPANTQRLFTRVMGLSPRAWQRQQRAEAFRGGLAAQDSTRITDVVYDAGFSGPSRAHTGAPLGMEPRQYRAGGAAQHIHYATAPCPLGIVLVAATERGVCAVFLGDSSEALEADLRARFPRAQLERGAGAHLDAALAAVQAAMSEHPAALDLPLDLRGTAFQARVWEALRAIARGQTRTYAEVAAAIGAPAAVRAVGTACGANPVSLLVPCHRVVGSNGKLTGYRWGTARKRALLEQEKQAAQGAGEART